MKSIPRTLSSERGRSIAPYLVAGLLGVVAFALACYEITDRDVWWQLRSGQWIIEHRRIPGLDPFSYGCADREWVDLHWLFQIVLFGAYRACGLPGVVLLAGACAASSVLIGFAATASNRPWLVCAACWLPALALMGWRLPPRPEMFSLVFLATDLAILEFGRKRPRLLWCLPVVQLLWVNSHGLFILGPLVASFDWFDRMRAVVGRRLSAPAAWANEPDAMSEWRRAAAVLACVAAASFVNPYGIRGAAFPWQLLPKIASEENLYKQTVEEFTPPIRALRNYRGGIVAGRWYLGQEFLLLGLLPVSFVLPAVWQAWRSSAAAGKGKRRGEPPQAGGMSLAWRTVGGVLAVLLPAMSAASLPGASTPRWALAAGNWLPCGFLLLGLAGSWMLRASRSAALMAACGAAGCAAWLAWLRLYFCGSSVAAAAEDWIPRVAALTLVVGAATVWLALRHGASVFRLLLAAAFAYLALQAVRNSTLFGLIAGAVLAGNFGDYFAAASERKASRFARLAAFAGHGAFLMFLFCWLSAIVNGESTHQFRYYDWLRHSRKFGIHEKPFWSAHDAAKFAGQEGMPERAIAFGFEQAGVYLFHNGPERKTYLDPRLEIPDAEVYRTYLGLFDGLAENDPRWPAQLAQIGHPLVLIAHAENERREASLLMHPLWRCVYFDAVAAIFVHRDQAAGFPAVDFAERRMRAPQPSVPQSPGAAYREAIALSRLGAELKRFPEQTWTHRIPVLLAAREQIDFALQEESGSARVWALLGYCLSAKIADAQPSAADAEWTTGRDLPWAQAAYAYCRALEALPGDPEALGGLYQLFAARGMIDAQAAVGDALQTIGWASPEQSAETERLKRVAAALEQQSRESPERQFFDHVRAGRALAALAVVEQNPDAARQWPVAEQAARLCLLMGTPGQAREYLNRAWQPPDAARRQMLLADADAAEQQRNAAAELYREVVANRPDRSDAWLALAALCAEAGDAAGALEACRGGLAASPREAARAELQAWQTLLDEHHTAIQQPTNRQ